MEWLKSLFEKKSLVSIICGIVCIIIIYFAYTYRIEQKVKAVEVPYALNALSARTQITQNDVGTVKVAKTMLTENTVKNKKDVIDKYVNYNTFIPKGSLFYSSSIVEWRDMPDSAWSNIEENNTIVSLSVSGLTMFSTAIYPGAKIDLYYQTYDNDGKLVYGKLVENIKVLAVKDQNGKHIFSKGANQKSASALIFSVSDVPEADGLGSLHILLRKAMYLNGSIVPVLRNSKYTSNSESATAVSSSYLKKLIIGQSIVLDEDKVQTVEQPSNINVTE